VQLERVGCDFQGGGLSIERHEVARLARSSEAAKYATDGTLAHVPMSGHEPNLIVEMELRRKHICLIGGC
jgi:hypothetical protein